MTTAIAIDPRDLLAAAEPIVRHITRSVPHWVREDRQQDLRLHLLEQACKYNPARGPVTAWARWVCRSKMSHFRSAGVAQSRTAETRSLDQPYGDALDSHGLVASEPAQRTVEQAEVAITLAWLCADAVAEHGRERVAAQLSAWVHTADAPVADDARSIGMSRGAILERRNRLARAIRDGELARALRWKKSQPGEGPLGGTWQQHLVAGLLALARPPLVRGVGRGVGGAR